MKSTLKYFAAAFAIVAAAACSKELSSTDDINCDDQPKVQMTFTASIGSDVKTKTALNNKLLEWTAGDKITLYGNGVYNTPDGYNKHKGYCTIEESSISNDKTSAAFIGNVASSSDYCALYPADGWNVNTMVDYKYEFKGFADQKAVKNSFDPSKHVMVAGHVDGTKISFMNVCALAKVTIATDLVYSVKIDGTDIANGSIGGPFGWKINKDLNNYAAVTSNKIHTITLRNENGAPLENGATYYIVLPACTISNYSVSVCDQNGFVIGSKAKASDFIVERSKIYDMGTFDNTNVKPVEILNVNTTSLNLDATNGFDFFTITSNRNWKITSNASWLSFDITSGEPGSNLYIKVSANNNTAYTARTATVTVTGEKESRTISVTQAAAVKPQTYRKVKDVHVDEMVDGKKYAIRLQGDSNRYWKNENGKLVLTSLTNGEFRKENVFIFIHKTHNDDKVSGYNAEQVGVWKSLSNSMTLDANFNFSANTEQWITLANRYGNDKGYDVDIYKNATNNFLYCNRSYQPAFGAEGSDAAGWNGNAYRKWYIYEVTEEQ
jgi:hypothetical protein